MSKWAEVHVRADDHVCRLVARLIAEEVEFQVRPEPDGWWLVRAKPSATYPIGGLPTGFGRSDLESLTQATLLAPP